MVVEQFPDAGAARDWFLRPTSSSPENRLWTALTVTAEPTSAVPARWIPQLLAGAVLASLVSPYISSALRPAEDLRWRGLPDLDFAKPLHHPEAQQNATTLVTRHIEDLEAILHLTRSQIAQALGVERATLYQWFRGAQPRPRTGERLEQLRQFATAWQLAGLGSARAAWHLKVPGSERTLGALLTADPIDLNQLQGHIRHAQQAPQTMEFVEPKAAPVVVTDDPREERHRNREFFPPTLEDSE